MGSLLCSTVESNMPATSYQHICCFQLGLRAQKHYQEQKILLSSCREKKSSPTNDHSPLSIPGTSSTSHNILIPFVYLPLNCWILYSVRQKEWHFLIQVFNSSPLKLSLSPAVFCCSSLHKSSLCFLCCRTLTQLILA